MLNNLFNTKDRKLDHIKITLERNVESKHPTLLHAIFVEHNPVPELNLNDINASTKFLGKEIAAPIIITGMTGGHPATLEINKNLAEIASKHRIALGVGSQRAAIEDSSLRETFSIARKIAPEIPIIANIGAPQLVKGYGVKQAIEAVEMIEADALAIHLNPLQEAFQVEGDTDYEGVVNKIKEIADALPVPVIIKETGTGLSGETVHLFYKLGIKYFDISGLGGTNWGKVEALRAEEHGYKNALTRINGYGDYWGNPTAYSLIQSRLLAPRATIIASGGVRTGLDIVRALVAGADLGGIALPALRVLLKNGKETLSTLIEDLIYQVKVGMYLTGSRVLRDLKCKPFKITDVTLENLLKHVDPIDYYRVKCTNSLKVPKGWII